MESDLLLDVIEPVTMALLGKENALANIESLSTSKDNTTDQTENKTITVSEDATDPFADVIGEPGKIPSIKCTLPSQSKDFRPEMLIPLLDAGTINVVYDWSELQVDNMTFNAYMQHLCANDQTKVNEECLLAEEYIRAATTSFIDKANNKLKETHLSSINVNSPIRLIVKLRKTDIIGWKYVIDFVFVNTETKEILNGVKLEKNAYKILGMKGSMVYNLAVTEIKDHLNGQPPSMFLATIYMAMEKMGDEFGKKLNNALKDAKKKR